MIRESLLAFTLLTGSNLMDATSTKSVIAAGGREEMNPRLYGPYAERIVPVKFVISAAETAVFYELRRRKRKTLAWCWVGAIVGANFYITHQNEKLARELRKIK